MFWGIKRHAGRERVMNRGKFSKSQAGSTSVGRKKPFELTSVEGRGRVQANLTGAKATSAVAPQAPKSAPTKQVQKPATFAADTTPVSRKRKIVAGALAVVVLGLMVAQFVGSGDHPANPAPFVSAAVADTTQTQTPLALVAVEQTTGTLQGDSDGNTGIFDSIIGTLRSDKVAPAPDPVPAAATPAPKPTQSLVSLVSQALIDEKSRVEIAQLLNTANADGRISVPRQLLRSDGTVDTDTILLLFTAN